MINKKEQHQLDNLVNVLRRKVFKNEEFTQSERIFAKYFIEQVISEKTLIKPDTLNTDRPWDIKLFWALNNFKRKIRDIKNREDDINMIPTLHQIFVLQSYIEKTKDYSWLEDAVSKYYKDCFIKNRKSNVIPDIILFESNKMTIKCSFVGNSVTLFDKKKKETYTRDIELSELVIFPNSRLKQQYIG